MDMLKCICAHLEVNYCSKTDMELTEFPAKKLQVEDNPDTPTKQEHDKADKFPVHCSRRFFNNALQKLMFNWVAEFTDTEILCTNHWYIIVIDTSLISSATYGYS